MDGWGVVCTDSVYMLLLSLYTRDGSRGWRGVDHAYAADTEQDTETQARGHIHFTGQWANPIGNGEGAMV
jgi:hypothetical protein